MYILIGIFFLHRKHGRSFYAYCIASIARQRQTGREEDEERRFLIGANVISVLRQRDRVVGATTRHLVKIYVDIKQYIGSGNG